MSAQVRVMKKALGNRVKIKLSSNHALVAWMVPHASDVLNKYMVGKDGKTPYERWKGKPWGKESVEFGELIHMKLPKKKDRGKLEDRWTEGIFVGVRWRTGEYLVNTEQEARRNNQKNWNRQKMER